MKPPYSFVSIALIAICLLVALMSGLGASTEALSPLLIATPGSEGFSDIMNGQIWRLITPVFIHFGFMHLFFNLMWVWDLGRLIEAKKGIHFYLGFVLIIGTLSNIAQYLFTDSPLFGGMSGVLYGMFGYIWIRGRYDPLFSDDLHKNTIVMMLVWFVLCWTGLLGPIANWAHSTGLLIGAVWAYLDKLSGNITPVAAADMPVRQQLRYLSTADMLQLETRREWVRQHCLPEAQDQYDSIEGKLLIIDTIINQKYGKAFTRDEILSLEIAFGDALIQETGAGWATLEDRNNRTPVLFMPENPHLIFQVKSIGGWIMRKEQGDIHQLFRHTVQLMQRQIRQQS